MNFASAILKHLKPEVKPPKAASFRHPAFRFRHFSFPLSPQPSSHPISAPRQGPTRPGPLKSNFLACIVGARTHIATGVILCGGVKVGELSHVGASAVVRPGIRISARAVVGAGAVVVKDVPDGATVVGDPTRVVPSC